ncbi:APC amino acid permease [Gamsiella multidivaricata]|uniref:APC amino acid permease n=1 Tax=Gamsiella multidivaricata TaxID=101098 RepID=UPI002220F4B8|nr:APC amino acid permease [Gamsiella multidivaricata]KAI7820544.1 APC amino acid permease [Gamsiella multidivaricata]
MENTEKGHAADYNEDEARLARLGYKQNMKRQFSGLQNFGFTLTNSSVLIGIVPLFGFGMTAGGPVVAIWGWLLVAFFVMFIGLGMAEICSTYPTAGGLYFWTAKLGGPKWGPMFSWYEAWFNMLGQVAGCSGSVLAAATFMNNLISVWQPTYETDGKKNFYIMAALMVIAGLVNSAGGRALKIASLVSVFIHIVGTIVIIIVVLAGAPKLQTAKFVFTDFEDHTGYTTSSSASPVFVFLLGLLQSQWSMLGYDASAHMSEETEKSYVNGPRGILLSIFASVLIGLGLALALTFGIQDYNTTLSSSIGAAPQIFIDCAGKRGGSVLIFIIVFAGFLCGIATVAANSRMIYAFARDGGLPFSRYWTVLNRRTQMPLRLVWLSVVIIIILALPSFGSTATLSAISGISIIGFTVSYAIPILLRITVGASTFVQHEFNLGKFSRPVGWIAVIWTIFIFIIFNLPQSWPVDDMNAFNFTPAAVGFLLIFTTLTWFLSARHWFKGPVSEIALQELDGIVPVDLDEKQDTEKTN